MFKIEILLSLIASLIVVFIIFLVIREIVLWYLKINLIIDRLYKQEEYLHSISKILVEINDNLKQ